MKLAAWQDRDSSKGRMKRRAYPVHAFCGPNGTGKSAVMVYDTMTSLDWGRPVLSTVRLLDYTRPRPCPGGAFCDDPEGHVREVVTTQLVPLQEDDPDAGMRAVRVPTGQTEVHRAAHPLYVRFTDYQQLLDLRDADCLMDEVTGVASSRDSMSGMPTQVANLLVQLRRRNVVLRWSAPSFKRADKIIREVSQAVTLTEARMGKKAPARPGEPPRLWKERRYFIARTFAGEQFNDEGVITDPDARPVVTQRLWGPGSGMFDAYDTYDPVSALGWAQESGLCGHCGGHRSRRKCGCDDHKEHGKAGGVRPKAQPPAPAPVGAAPLAAPALPLLVPSSPAVQAFPALADVR